MAIGFGTVDEIVQRLVRAFLGGKDEIAAIVCHHFGDGLTGEEIIAEIHGAQGRQPRVMLAEPAFNGVTLAILLLGAILGRDEFGHERHDFGMAGRHGRRCQHGMIRLRLAVGTLAREAMRAAYFLRAKIFGSVPAMRLLPPSLAKAWRMCGSASSVSNRSKQGASSAGSASS